MAVPQIDSYVIVFPQGVVSQISPNFIEVEYQDGDEFEVSDLRPPYNNAENMRNRLQVGDDVFSVNPGRVDRIDDDGTFYVRFDDGKGVALADPGNNNGMNVFIPPPNRPPLAPGEALRANAPEYVPGVGLMGGRRRRSSRKSTRNSKKSKKSRKSRKSTRKSRKSRKSGRR